MEARRVWGANVGELATFGAVRWRAWPQPQRTDWVPSPPSECGLSPHPPSIGLSRASQTHRQTIPAQRGRAAELWHYQAAPSSTPAGPTQRDGELQADAVLLEHWVAVDCHPRRRDGRLRLGFRFGLRLGGGRNLFLALPRLLGTLRLVIWVDLGIEQVQTGPLWEAQAGRRSCGPAAAPQSLRGVL